MLTYRVQNYITNTPTCLGTSAPSSGSLYIVFCKIMNYSKETVTIVQSIHGQAALSTTMRIHKEAVAYSLQYINLLKPTGYVTWCTNSLTFNSCTFCPYCIYVFCIYLRTNSDLCHLQLKLIGFYNRDENCLQRGTDWIFK
jgi:hypothetical protein